jgi:hypothetical protein
MIRRMKNGGVDPDEDEDDELEEDEKYMKMVVE